MKTIKKSKAVKAWACKSRMLGLKNMAQITIYSEKKMAKICKSLGDDVVRVEIKELSK